MVVDARGVLVLVHAKLPRNVMISYGIKLWDYYHPPVEISP